METLYHATQGIACSRLSHGGKEEVSPGSLFIAALYFFLSTTSEPGTGYTRHGKHGVTIEWS